MILCRSGRGRKLSGDQITLPTTVDFSASVPKQVSVAPSTAPAMSSSEFSVWDLKRQTTQRFALDVICTQVWLKIVLYRLINTARDWRMEFLGWRCSYKYQDRRWQWKCFSSTQWSRWRAWLLQRHGSHHQENTEGTSTHTQWYCVTKQVSNQWYAEYPGYIFHN